MRKMYSLEQLKNLIESGATAKAIEVIESGLVDNAKPIYIHPIVLLSSTSHVSLSLFIFDNSDEPYDTWTKIKAKMKSIADAIEDTARFPSIGSAIKEGTPFTLRNIDASTSGTFTVYGMDDSGNSVYMNITNMTTDVCFDGVNKIN